jgi:hypothetical protein
MGVEPTLEAWEGDQPLSRSCTVISFLERQTCAANQPTEPGKDLGKNSKPQNTG